VGAAAEARTREAMLAAEVEALRAQAEGRQVEWQQKLEK